MAADITIGVGVLLPARWSRRPLKGPAQIIEGELKRDRLPVLIGLGFVRTQGLKL